jgi:hypothetical protein
MTLLKLEQLVNNQPAYADIPFVIVRGQSMTPRQALANLKAGRLSSEILQAMQVAGYDPAYITEDEWRLAEEYYRVMMRNPRQPVIASIGYLPQMTYQQALNEISGRTPIGESLARAHLALIGQIRALIT